MLLCDIDSEELLILKRGALISSDRFTCSLSGIIGGIVGSGHFSSLCVELLGMCVLLGNENASTMEGKRSAFVLWLVLGAGAVNAEEEFFLWERHIVSGFVLSVWRGRGK